MAVEDFYPTHRAPASGLPVWGAPGSVRKLVAEIPAGTELQVLEREGEWTSVRWSGGGSGWVATRDLGAPLAQPLPLALPTPPSPPPPPPGVARPARAGGSRVRKRWFIAIAAIAAVAVVAAACFVYFTRRSQPAGVASHITQASLLADAYAGGRIDRPTWLRYRAYSMFGNDSLPAEYRSGDRDTDDAALTAELEIGLPLPSDVRAELMAYVGRPANRGSVFYGRGPVQTRAGANNSPVLDATAVCGADNWTSRNSQHHAFKVWTRCSGTYEERLDRVIDVLDGLWPPMTQLMGAPIPDLDAAGVDPASYGGDGYIDLYLLPRDTEVTSGGRTSKLSGLAEAVTISTAPRQGTTSSAYMLFDEGHVNNVGFPSTLAHEFFHALEFAHNYTAQFETVRFHLEENWFGEASSVWAQSHFVPSSAPADAYFRGLGFLARTMPIDAHGPSGSGEFYHLYEDFLWLYFMEQEAGPGAIAAAWQSSTMHTATDGKQATAAFDEVFPFSKHFGEFVLRNLDDPALKAALGRSYQDLDLKFPKVDQSSSGQSVPVRSGSLFIKKQKDEDPHAINSAVTLDHLTGRYYEVTFDADLDHVTWDVTAPQANEHLQADLIIFPLSANPTPRRMPLPLGTTQLCDVKGIERAILVVSNADVSGSSGMSVAAKGTTQKCAPQIQVTSVTPNTVPESQSSMLVIKGSGFANPDLSLRFKIYPTGKEDDPVECPCDIPPEPIVDIVSDTEIHYTAHFSSEATPGVYDVRLRANATVSSGLTFAPFFAYCKGCLTLTAPP